MSEQDTAQDTEKARPGRGRPSNTIERDEKVLATLDAASEPLTRDQLAEAAGVPSNEVYLSLYRLRRDGKAERLKDRGKGLSNKYWPVGKELPVAPEQPEDVAEAADAAPAPPEG
jgi:hypothetical protein